MSIVLGIRREEKAWERRAPIVPDDLKELIKNHQFKCIVQSSNAQNANYPRIFPDSDYEAAGAIVKEDMSECDFILGIKEIPIPLLTPEKIFMYFSHTIKGQAYNLKMLQHLVDTKSTLLDYEVVTDEKNRRLIFFGKYAGIAGMIECLWALGQRLSYEGFQTDLTNIKQTFHYESLPDAKNAIKEVGKQLIRDGIPQALKPLVVGFTGYGNVSIGAQEILDLLPMKEITPAELLTLHASDENVIYKVVFKEIDTVKPIDSNQPFDLMDYFKNPEKYESQFEQYVPHLSCLVNCIFWTERNPKLITREHFKNFYRNGNFKLKVIGDISCDIDGAIEATKKATKPDNPVFVYHPEDDTISDGFEGNGPVIMSVDNLPCELARESSIAFSKALKPFIPALVSADYSTNFDNISLPAEVKKAVILFKGKFTPPYEYMKKYITK